MKFVHLSDLHIGKTINGFSMLEDQQFIFNEIVLLCKEHQVDAVVIAGDIYDKANPSAEAVQLYDSFITNLAKLGIPLFIISGNHDSPERLSFASKIMEQMSIHVYGLFNGEVEIITMEDEYGPVNFYLLPFLKPPIVRYFYPEANVITYQDAIDVVLKHTPVNTNERNVIVAHQFVVSTGVDPERSDSEIAPVGGIDSVNAHLFANFDYVALGHLHGPQKIGSNTIRYAGSPLKYSFSESHQNKSITIVEMNQKGNVEFSLIPLSPLRDLRRISGPMHQLISPEILRAVNTQDYLQVTLTDSQELIEPMAKLRTHYPNIMELHYDNSRTRAASVFNNVSEIDNKSPIELFFDFYHEQNGQIPSTEQTQKIIKVLNSLEDSI